MRASSCWVASAAAWSPMADAADSAAWNAAPAFAWVPSRPVTSLNSPGVERSPKADESPAGSGTVGAFWIVTSGAGRGVGVRSGSGVARVSVPIGRICGSSSWPSVVQRQ